VEVTGVLTNGVDLGVTERGWGLVTDEVKWESHGADSSVRTDAFDGREQRLVGISLEQSMVARKTCEWMQQRREQAGKGGYASVR
jgi:hypothetical protein